MAHDIMGESRQHRVRGFRPMLTFCVFERSFHLPQLRTQVLSFRQQPETLSVFLTQG